MGSVLRPGFDKILRHSPAQSIFCAKATDQLVVLAYHQVDDPKRLAEHMNYIRQRGRPVSVHEVIAAITDQQPLPRGATLVTFDDGHPSVLSEGAPILAQVGVPGVAFIVAGFLDTDEPFWWEETADLMSAGGRTAVAPVTDPSQLVRHLKSLPDGQRIRAIQELRDSASRPAIRSSHLRRADLPVLESAGIDIGNHSLTHPCLHRCETSKVQTELTAAHSILEEALGHAPVCLAYPNGDWNNDVLVVVEELGYSAAFVFDHRINQLPLAHPLLISRVRVSSSTSVDRLAIITSGLHPAIHRALGRA